MAIFLRENCSDALPPHLRPDFVHLVTSFPEWIFCGVVTLRDLHYKNYWDAPHFFCWDAQQKNCWDAPPVTLRVKKKISAKQKIGEGVVNCWCGGECGKCTYGPRQFFVSKRMWVKNCSTRIMIRISASTNILSRWWCIPRSTAAASVAERS